MPLIKAIGKELGPISIAFGATACVAAFTVTQMALDVSLIQSAAIAIPTFITSTIAALAAKIYVLFGPEDGDTRNYPLRIAAGFAGVIATAGITSTGMSFIV